MNRPQFYSTSAIPNSPPKKTPNNPFGGGESNSDLRQQLIKGWRIVRKRWLWASLVAVTTMTAVTIHTLKQPRVYASQMVLLINDNSDSAPVQGQSLTRFDNDLETQIQILKSGSVIAQAIDLIEDPTVKVSVGEVAGSLGISKPEGANILNVSYKGNDPQKIKLILEALGQAYVNYSLESRQSRANNAIEFIEEQIPEAKQKLDKSAEDIRNFRLQYGFVDPDAFANSLVGTKQGLEQQIYQGAIALETTNQQYQELLRQMQQAGLNPQSALTNSILTQDDGYRTLTNQLQSIELQYVEESLRYKDNHPVLEDLRIQRAEIMELLQERVQKILSRPLPADSLTNGAISSSENSLAQSLNSQLLAVQTEMAVQMAQMESVRETQALVEERFQQVPALQQEYTELQRQYDLNSSAYNNFLQKLQDLKISQAEENAPWKILQEPGLPTNPIFPNVQQNLVLGLIGSVGLGVLVAILLEWLDPRIKDPEEAKALVGVPPLGLLPIEDKKDAALSLVVEADRQLTGYSFSPFTESIRSTALNLTYLTPKRGAKVIAFTSAVPKEGKSTVTYNLGQIIANLGNRVLVVDADLHRPSIHKFLRESENTMTTLSTGNEGLSTVLATDSSWQDALYRSEGNDFHVLPAGPMPPYPMALLNSQKMTDLLNEWYQAYDYVLIDTPPIVGITDAQSIATKVDEMILVVSINVPSRSAVKRASEIIESVGGNIGGLIVNRVPKEQQEYYYDYYASYYTGTSRSRNGVSHQNGSSVNGT